MKINVVEVKDSDNASVFAEFYEMGRQNALKIMGDK